MEVIFESHSCQSEYETLHKSYTEVHKSCDSQVGEDKMEVSSQSSLSALNPCLISF